MISTMCLVLLQVTATLTAPLQFPLQPLQGTIQQQRLALQEQLFALQQFQAMTQMNLLPSVPMNIQPILVLYPNNEENNDPDMRQKYLNTINHQKPIEGDEDSEVIHAEMEVQVENNTKKSPMRAVLLMPTSRGIIGDFISNISWLPIEINVPDSISWIYNGIAGIIAGIGQSWPFTQTESASQGGAKSIWKQMHTRNPGMPIVMIPLGQPTQG